MFYRFNKTLEVDLIREITVNTNILSNILTHCPENIYAEIYAGENDGQHGDGNVHTGEAVAGLVELLNKL